MALSVEKLLTDAHMLIARLKDHDSLADSIIGNSQALFNKVEAMKQYQDDITELNEIAKHRPRSTLVLGIAQENRQIRQLQQENRELEASLEEHQSALELIMQKYREHTVKLLQSNQIERALKEKEFTEKSSMSHLMDKIDEMAGVMQKAIEVDETTGCVDKEKLSRLEVENKALREMLEICTTSRERIVLPESILKEQEVSKLEETSGQIGEGGEEEEEETDSESDTSTLKKEHSSKNQEDDSSDTDSSTLKRKDTPSKDKEEPAKENKKDAVEPKKKTEPKKAEAAGKDGSTSKETTATRSGSKSPVSSKSITELKKTRATASPVKKASSSTSVTKKETPSSLRKSPSVDAKKDLKSKTASKAPSKK